MEKQIENRWESREVGCGGGDQLKTGSRSLKTRLYRGGRGLQEGGGSGAVGFGPAGQVLRRLE